MYTSTIYNQSKVNSALASKAIEVEKGKAIDAENAPNLELIRFTGADAK